MRSVQGLSDVLGQAALQQMWCVSWVGGKPTALRNTCRAMEGPKQALPLWQSSQSNKLGWGLRTHLFKSPTAAQAQGSLQLTQGFSHLYCINFQAWSAQHTRTSFFSCLSDLKREKKWTLSCFSCGPLSYSSSYHHSKRSNGWVNNLLRGIWNLLLSSPKACSLWPSVFHIL